MYYAEGKYNTVLSLIIFTVLCLRTVLICSEYKNIGTITNDTGYLPNWKLYSSKNKITEKRRHRKNKHGKRANKNVTPKLQG